MSRRFQLPALASALLLVSVVSLSSGRTAESPAGEGVEISSAASALLQQLNTASEQTLKGPVGLPEGIVAKIMAFRAGGKKFSTLVQVRSVTKMSSQELERILLPFEQKEAERAFEAQRKPVPEPATAGAPARAGGRQRDTAATDHPAKEGEKVTGEGPITAVRPGFYGKLPGYEDLDKIDPLKKTEFLETVNREFCTCGCKNETIAFCLVNDPSCPVVKSRAKKIYDDIMNKPAH